MLIDQIIEFQLKGPGPPGLIYIDRTGYFQKKTKIFKKNLRLDHYLLLKISQKVMYLVSPYLG